MRATREAGSFVYAFECQSFPYARYVDVALNHHGNPEAARLALEKMSDGSLKEAATASLATWEKRMGSTR